MPRELVIQRNPVFIDEAGNVVEDETERFVQITWSGEAEYVQIVTGERAATTHESNSDEWVFVDLQRYDINKLIKVLRRARNAVYGVDE